LTSESLTVTFGQTTTYTVQSAYDAANRRTGITYPDGSVVARQYTARDQLSQIDYNTDMVATFAYDSASRRTSRVLGDAPGTQTAWVYGRQDNLPTAINAGVAGRVGVVLHQEVPYDGRVSSALCIVSRVHVCARERTR
jgi:YD repeat-containing protein